MYGTVVSFTTNFPTSGYSNYNNYGYNNNGYYDNYSGYNNNSMSPVAITTAGEVLSSNTAQFKALILPGNSSEANTWFEWGTTPNLGNQTVIVPINGAPAIRHTNTITGLTPGTAYYFRAVAQNSYGKNEGVVLSLVTNGSAPSIRKNTTSTTTNTTTTNVSGITSMADTTSVDRSINGAPTASMLGANVFGASSFFPSNLFGWLLILVMILAVVFLSRRLHGQIKNQEEHK